MKAPFIAPALLLAIFGSLAPLSHAAVDFDREIRPILSDNCFACHGPDEKNRMAKLRVDVQDGGAYTKGIIVPGKAQESRLVQRISEPAAAKRMPPPYFGRTLTPQQVELIKTWVDQGAKWETHWAFASPKRPELPAVKDPAWARNPIDRFILARLDNEQWQPSPEAAKATLLRRVTYDLTGLPPTLDELNSFLADTTPGAYEKRVDALLASPRYGERMAVQWLDLARYADTHGYHIDSTRDMWHWRDWVVRAFNRNMPYDQFTLDQVAGDLLPNATTDDKLASGFNRNHMINFEGGAIPEEYQVEYVVDRVEATSTTWMGLTMGCARCHDHKYDPISQKEFYRFFAFFNNVAEQGLDGRSGNAEPFLQLPSDRQKLQQQELKAAIEAHQKALPDAGVQKLQAVWESAELASFPAAPQNGLQAHYAFDGNLTDSSGHYRFARVLKGDMTYGSGAVDRGADFDGETRVGFGSATALVRDAPFSISWWMRVNSKDALTLLQQAGLEIYLDDFELSGIQQRVPRLYVRFSNPSPANAFAVRTAQRLPLPNGKDMPGVMNHIVLNYDGSGKAGGLRLFVDGKPAALEVLKDPQHGTAPAGGALEIGNKGFGAPFKGRLDDLRIYNRQLLLPEIAQLYTSEPLRAVLLTLPDKRAKSQTAWIRDYYLTHAAPPAYQQTWAELKALEESSKTLEAQIPTTMVMSELTEKPRETFILGRGDYRNQTEKVTPGVPAVLPPLPKDAPLNRLTLARWLVDPANPLTARVAVNRFWQMYFGTGLVKTAENFGAQGDPPSHPQLLDWLATEFVGSAWDVKALQRLIVTSATYRQSSRVTPEMLERDPENRLLAHGPRFRLPSEMLRDGELYMGGLLKEKAGGPGVSPYQPKGLWEEIAFGDGFTAQAYVQGHGDDLYRRSLYTFWKRTSPPPEMTTFDAPDREKCSARRTVTNTPLQALVLLNDPAFVEAARGLAQRIVLQGGRNTDQRIDYGFRVATAREPAAQEMALLRDAYNRQLLHFKQHEDQAASLLKVGESPIAPHTDRAELAAWTTVASMLLNLDETITKE